jgi:hypothetical protein
LNGLLLLCATVGVPAFTAEEEADRGERRADASARGRERSCFIEPDSLAKNRDASLKERSQAVVGAGPVHLREVRQGRASSNQLDCQASASRQEFKALKQGTVLVYKAREYNAAENKDSPTKNTNASFQVSTSASFTARWPGHSGGAGGRMQTAG